MALTKIWPCLPCKHVLAASQGFWTSTSQLLQSPWSCFWCGFSELWRPSNGTCPWYAASEGPSMLKNIVSFEQSKLVMLLTLLQVSIDEELRIWICLVTHAVKNYLKRARTGQGAWLSVQKQWTVPLFSLSVGCLEDCPPDSLKLKRLKLKNSKKLQQN